MNGGETIFLNHTLGNQDGILKVVSVPRHEGDAHVLTQRQFTQIGGRAIGHHVATRNHITRFSQRTLVNTGVLVGTGVLGQVVDIDTGLTGNGFIVVDANHDTAGIDRIDHTTTRATTVTPESTATVRSIPVPTSGFSARRVGTA